MADTIATSMSRDTLNFRITISPLRYILEDLYGRSMAAEPHTKIRDMPD
jgi:hypothetical protein